MPFPLSDMNEFSILLTLAAVHFVALMSPGPDFALVVHNSVRNGRLMGFCIALGLSCGILIHSVLSLLGVSYVVHQHPLLYALVQLCGGSYLLYLGKGALWGAWKSRGKEVAIKLGSSMRLFERKRQAFFRGFLTNILNPKALVFFISLLSSLVPAGMSNAGKGMALFILWGLALLWFTALAWLLSTDKMQRKVQSMGMTIELICGLAFTLIGGTILFHSLSAFYLMT